MEQLTFQQEGRIYTSRVKVDKNFALQIKFGEISDYKISTSIDGENFETLYAENYVLGDLYRSKFINCETHVLITASHKPLSAVITLSERQGGGGGIPDEVLEALYWVGE